MRKFVDVGERTETREDFRGGGGGGGDGGTGV